MTQVHLNVRYGNVTLSILNMLSGRVVWDFAYRVVSLVVRLAAKPSGQRNSGMNPKTMTEHNIIHLLAPAPEDRNIVLVATGIKTSNRHRISHSRLDETFLFQFNFPTLLRERTRAAERGVKVIVQRAGTNAIALARFLASVNLQDPAMTATNEY